MLLDLDAKNNMACGLLDTHSPHPWQELLQKSVIQITQGHADRASTSALNAMQSTVLAFVWASTFFTIRGVELMAQCALQGFYTVYSAVFKKLAEEERQAAAAQSDQQDKDTASNLPAFGEHTFCTPTMLLVVESLIKQRQSCLRSSRARRGLIRTCMLSA